MARRFFVDKNNITVNESSINVIGEEVHHINVLRHKVGDVLKINEYEVEVVKITKDELIGKIIGVEDISSNKKYTLTLYQSYLKSDKMEFVTQKAVELGIDKIVPFLSKNSVVKLDEKDKVKKVQRLNKISKEASKQCGRMDIVEVADVLNISSNEFYQNLSNHTFVIFAYEGSNNSLKKLLKNIENDMLEKKQNISIAIVIGPEGGFDKKDIEVLEKLDNVYEISLGKNILRAETASLNLISVITYQLND